MEHTLTKIWKTRITCKKTKHSTKYFVIRHFNRYYRSQKARTLMTGLVLHFWSAAATFRIWSSGKKNPYFKYASSHSNMRRPNNSL